MHFQKDFFCLSLYYNAFFIPFSRLANKSGTGLYLLFLSCGQIQSDNAMSPDVAGNY